MVKNERRKCFVIMPFSKTTDLHTDEYWNKHYINFLKPLIESSHIFKAVRSEALRGDILRQIITDLITTPLVVADLTDANPNVYWELGVRQSFKHSTITIAEHDTKLPFDLTTKGTIFYDTSYYIKMEEFKKQFIKAVVDCHENPESPDSYVLESIGGRGTLYQIIMRDESLRRLDAIIAETQSNQDSWKHISEVCENNIKNRAGSKKGDLRYATEILRHCCVDLLISTRYISATPDFYEAAEYYSNEMMRVNERLPHWPDNTRIEKWLNNRTAEMSETISKFESFLKQQKEAIEVIQ
jgi:hypothetical protein